MTRYLIAGAGGMLGTALRAVLAGRGLLFVAPPEREFDITDERSVRETVRAFQAQAAGESGVLINAAAYTNVERAEDEPELAHRVNAEGPRLLAEAAGDAGLGFVHVSTDFVFDGRKTAPYVETDEPNPCSVYGASKLAGERAVVAAHPDALIVRTAWAFGPSGVNFPAKILGLASRMPELKVVTDEVGSPTYTVDLADGLVSLAESGAHGMFHLAGAGSCSRFELARAVLELSGLPNTLVPVTAAEFPAKACRPANSVLDCGKAAAFGVVMRPWREALAEFLGNPSAA